MGVPLLASCTGMWVSMRSELRLWLNVIIFNWIYHVLMHFPETDPRSCPRAWVEMLPMTSASFVAALLSCAINLPLLRPGFFGLNPPGLISALSLQLWAVGSPRVPGSCDPSGSSYSMLPLVLLPSIFLEVEGPLAKNTEPAPHWGPPCPQARIAMRNDTVLLSCWPPALNLPSPAGWFQWGWRLALAALGEAR